MEPHTANTTQEWAHRAPQQDEQSDISPEMRELLKQEALAALRHEIEHGTIQRYIEKNRERTEITKNTRSRGIDIGIIDPLSHFHHGLGGMPEYSQRSNTQSCSTHVEFESLSADFHTMSVDSHTHRRPTTTTKCGHFTVNMEYGPVEFRESELAHELLEAIKVKAGN